jgi:uncharacterized membrane protein
MTESITAYNVIKVLHILSMATWLGVDLGVFTCAWLSRNRTLSAEARGQFLKLLGILDLGPRVSMIATLPLGLTLAHLGWGVAPGFGAAVGWLIAVVCVAWAVLVVRQHHGLGRFTKPYARVDTAVRAVLVVALGGAAVWSFVGGPASGPIEPLWLRWKVLLFAGTIACGLWIRWQMRNAGPVFGATLTDDAPPAAFDALDRMIRSLYAPVFAIWGVLVISVFLAVAKPS